MDAFERITAFLTTGNFNFWDVPESYASARRKAPAVQKSFRGHIGSIKKLAAEGFLYSQIAAELGVSTQGLRQVVSDHNRAHSGDQIIVTSAKTLEAIKYAERDANLYADFKGGASYGELAKTYAICKPLVSRIVKRMSAPQNPPPAPIKKTEPDEDGGDWDI